MKQNLSVIFSIQMEKQIQFAFRNQLLKPMQESTLRFDGV
jgi:hypothetical protein